MAQPTWPWMPGSTGVPPQPGGAAAVVPTQVLPQHPVPGMGYSPDHLPPPPGMVGGGQGPMPGVPGAPVAHPFYAQPAGVPPTTPGGPTPQWPGQAPAGVPPAPQWPGQVPGAPSPPAPRMVQLDDSMVLDGPGVPQELRGRTWGDARRLYAALSTDWLQRNRPQATTPQVPAGPAPQYGGQQPPAAPAGGRPGGGAAAGSWWQNPDERIAQAIDQALERRLAPVLQQTQSQAIVQAREVARTGVSDFAYLEADIMQMLAGVDPSVLQNPQTWQLAANAVRGARMAAGQYAPPSAGTETVPGRRPNGVGPGTAVPAVPAYQFFTEGPTAPSMPGVGGVGPRQPTQEDQFYAQKWGMSIQEWMAWKYGQQQPAGVGGGY